MGRDGTWERQVWGFGPAGWLATVRGTSRQPGEGRGRGASLAGGHPSPPAALFQPPRPAPPQPRRQDGDFSEGRFRDVVNAALANNLGNGLNRTLNLLAKFHEGALPLDSGARPPCSRQPPHTPFVSHARGTRTCAACGRGVVAWMARVG